MQNDLENIYIYYNERISVVISVKYIKFFDII
jgi:hypothetical protein